MLHKESTEHHRQNLAGLRKRLSRVADIHEGKVGTAHSSSVEDCVGQFASQEGTVLGRVDFEGVGQEMNSHPGHEGADCTLHEEHELCVCEFSHARLFGVTECNLHTLLCISEEEVGRVDAQDH